MTTKYDFELICGLFFFHMDIERERLVCVCVMVKPTFFYALGVLEITYLISEKVLSEIFISPESFSLYSVCFSLVSGCFFLNNMHFSPLEENGKIG